MRYSYEFKLECVHQYKKDGSYPPTPEKVKQKTPAEKRVFQLVDKPIGRRRRAADPQPQSSQTLPP